MASATAKCKLCTATRSMGSKETPPDIAAEGVMEAIQEHIFQKHCDENLELQSDKYSSVGQAWTYV